MRKILVISDTHHNYDLMGSVFDMEKDFDSIMHLGDEHDDLDYFPEVSVNKTLYCVPGFYHKDYSKNSARCINLCIESWHFQLAHSPNDLQHQDTVFCIYLHGHTHKAVIRDEKGYIVLNPGHLKSMKDRGEFPSYMILEIDSSHLNISLKNIKGQSILNKKLTKPDHES